MLELLESGFPVILRGFGMTLFLLGAGGGIALAVGTLLAVMRISPVATLRTIATVYTEMVRNTPLMLVMVFCIMLLPQLGVRWSFPLLAMLALGVYTAPFFAEALRSGINGVPFGQAEAARSIGLTFGQTLIAVVLPQSFRMTIPPLINVVIALTKNTSVAAGFGVFELFSSGQNLVRDYGNLTVFALSLVALSYLVITVPLGYISRIVERKVSVLR